MVDAPAFAIGWQEPIYLPAPAAGAQWSYTVDGRYFERVISIFALFQTSAVVANRFPLVRIMDANGSIIAEVPLGATIVAGTLLTGCLMLAAPSFATGAGGAVNGFFPDILLPPGWSISTSVTNMDVGDQWSNIRLLMQRFPNDAASITAGG